MSRFASSEFDIDDILGQLCDVAAETLHVDGAGVMSLREGRMQFVRASRRGLDPLEQLQETLQTGPCRTAVDTAAVAAAPSLAEIKEHWPDFVDVAQQWGIEAMVAVPLVSRGFCWGTLDLFWKHPHRCDDRELADVQLLADVAVSYLVMASDRERFAAAQRHLADQVLHDQLTGLPNRGLIHELIFHALAAAERRGSGVAVLFVDLDHFKSINDAYGHQAGDTVLREIAARLRSVVRIGDSVARLAGDEFLILCEDLPTPADAITATLDKLAHRITTALAEPIDVGATKVTVTASIGIAVTTDSPTAADLIHEADTAMYEAKTHQFGGAVIRTDLSHADLTGRRGLEHGIFRALDRDEFRVFYQPIVDRGGRVVAVEALLRWQHPDRGLLAAADFIDAAQNTGAIVAIGHQVIRTAAADLARWSRDTPHTAPAMLWCNLSPRELGAPELPDVIADALTRHGLTPRDLGIEIVETHLGSPRLAHTIQTLQDNGHPLAIDDFGTGYSSLARLVDIPARYLKIDRTVVAGLPHDLRAQRLVRSIMTIARDLEISVISEGIERPDQSDYLTDAGSHLFQGYHHGRPMSVHALTDLLERPPLPA